MKERTAQNYKTSSDAQLLEAFTEVRDERAFGELVSRHGPMVMSTCRRRLRKEQDRQDAFQATFLTLVTKATWIREKSSVAGWLQRVAVRICLNLRRSNVRHQTEVFEATEAKKVDIETTLMIEEELARLPANYRNAIVLCHLEGHKSKDAADILGVPRNTLNSWLVRGRELMRKRLIKQGVGLSIGGLISGIVCLGRASGTVEASLIQETSRTATLYASGQLASTTTAVSLAKATITKMLLTKISSLTVIVLPICILTAGVLEGHKTLMASTIISDNFEGSFDGSWEIARGNGRLEFENGRMVVFADAGGVFVRPLSADGAPVEYADVTLDAEITIPDGMDAQVAVTARTDFSTTGSFGWPFGFMAGYDSEQTAQIFNIRSEGFQGLDGEGSTFQVNGQVIRSRFDVKGDVIEFNSWQLGQQPNGYQLADMSDDHTFGEVGFFVRPFGGNLNLGVEFDNISVVPEPDTSLGSLGLIAFFLFVRRKSQSR